MILMHIVRRSLSSATVPYLLILFALASVQHAGAQQSPGVDPFDPGAASFFASPSTIRPAQGKYPATVLLFLWLKGCDPKQKTGPTLAGTTAVSITVAGAGLSTTANPAPAIWPCEITTTLNIDPAAATSGFFLIDVKNTTDATKSVDLGYAILSLLDSAAGPIPANPQVDVLWGVLSKHLCGDNFGHHVANDVYCIEVKIGNNTGHQIQLAGVGFKLRIAAPNTMDASPNVSYQSVRASAQASQLLTPRNLLVNGAGSLGILMASTNPFFHAAWSLARWTALTSATGTALPSAINVIIPDPSVRQLNNLDDQTFRDGMLIPNNTQIRTMVFVERKLLEGSGYSAYEGACDALYPPSAQVTVAPNKDGTFTIDAPAKVAVSLKPDSGNSSQAILATSIATSQNAPSNVSTAANKCKKAKDDPLAVKWALGGLVIVGEEIDFIQRMVVDTSAITQAGNLNPVFTTVATANTVTVTFVGNAPASATATIASDSPPDPGFSSPVALTPSTSANPSQLVFLLPQSPATSSLLTDGDTYTVALTIPNVAPITQNVTVPITVTGWTATAEGVVTVTFNGNAPPSPNTAIKNAQIVPATGAAINLTVASPQTGQTNQIAFNVPNGSLPLSGTYTLTIQGVTIAAPAATFTVP